MKDHREEAEQEFYNGDYPEFFFDHGRVRAFVDEEGELYTIMELHRQYHQHRHAGLMEETPTFRDYISDVLDKDGALTELSMGMGLKKLERIEEALCQESPEGFAYNKEYIWYRLQEWDNLVGVEKFHQLRMIAGLLRAEWRFILPALIGR